MTILFVGQNYIPITNQIQLEKKTSRKVRTDKMIMLLLSPIIQFTFDRMKYLTKYRCSPFSQRPIYRSDSRSCSWYTHSRCWYAPQPRWPSNSWSQDRERGLGKNPTEIKVLYQGKKYIQGVPKKTLTSVKGSFQGIKWPQIKFVDCRKQAKAL